MLDRPIVLLGAARSGTTLFADAVFGLHPDVAYYPEPRFVWRYGNAYKPSDVLTAADATPAVRRAIRERFERFRHDAGRSRFAEKTPSNCFAVPFVREVLPGALFLHLVRDGRDVAVSAAKEWQGGGEGALDSPELREGSRVAQLGKGISRWAQLRDRVFDVRSALELPAYTGRLAAFAARKLLRPDRLSWGPRFPGIARVRREHTLLETTAIQWARSVEAARQGADGLGARYLELRYEDFVSNPRDTVARALAFLHLDAPDALVDTMASQVVSRPVPSWPRKLDPADVRALEAAVGDTLTAFDYPLSTDAHP